MADKRDQLTLPCPEKYGEAPHHLATQTGRFQVSGTDARSTKRLLYENCDLLDGLQAKGDRCEYSCGFMHAQKSPLLRLERG